MWQRWNFCVRIPFNKDISKGIEVNNASEGSSKWKEIVGWLVILTKGVVADRIMGNIIWKFIVLWWFNKKGESLWLEICSATKMWSSDKNGAKELSIDTFIFLWSKYLTFNKWDSITQLSKLQTWNSLCLSVIYLSLKRRF